MKPIILSVTQVNMFLKSLIEGDGRLADIYIAGEISNFTHHYRSGHLYFSLKDGKSVIRAVMFAGSAKKLKFMPQDGMMVVARGRVSVYEASGQYQIYVQDLQPHGVGALTIAFEQLKEKLSEEGLFSLETKRAIPPFPEKIGVITSETGAAVKDILDITRRRWPVAQIILSPVLVQGEQAAKSMIDAIESFNKKNSCDVIIIGRGGGSMEDLWAFNDECLARAIYQSQTPIVSAVGHETDFTICDFVSDLRAATPSAAAELCTPDINDLRKKFRAFNEYFNIYSKRMVNGLYQQIDSLSSRRCLQNPQEILAPLRRSLDVETEKLKGAAKGLVEKKKSEISVLAGIIDSLSPMKVLSRGYSLVTNESGEIVRRAQNLSCGDKIRIKMLSATINAEITEIESY